MAVAMPDDRAHRDATRDVVVVGGGLAGLAAAWRLRDHDVLLLEAADRLGGRVRSDPWGEYWLNYGAHLFPAPGTVVDRMAVECGLQTVPVTGTMMGLAVGRKLLTRGRVETYPLRLPMSARDRIAFATVGMKVQRAVRSRGRAAGARPGETPADVTARVLAFEDHRSFSEFLGPLPPAVERIFACAAHRASAELDELSAGCGIGLFALVWGGKGSLIARNLVGGSGQLPAALGHRLGARARTGCRVTGLRPDGTALVAEFDAAGRTASVRARHVIVAAQAPFAAPLVAPVARHAARALEQLTYGAFVSVAVQTAETQPMPWDQVYAMATPGRAFDMFTNQAHAVRGDGIRRPGGSLMLFAGGRAAAALLHEPDAVVIARFLGDLHDLYPQTGDVIADATVHRWPLGNVYARPGRHRLQAPLEGALGERANLHLAGDYFAELGNMEAAARTGLAAAERVAALLRTPPRARPRSTHDEVHHV
jgi:oxygen-dependent protoporphyrinogen oxidase